MLKEEYDKIIEDQLRGIVEEVPEQPTGQRVFYLPHKPVVRQNATTTKVRMVFDASAKPHPLANSINECMFTGPPLRPLLWDIMIRARMSTYLLLADIQKAFLQIGMKEEDRDAFRFLFDINGQEKQLRFARVPFGAEASPFLLGATLQYHLDQQEPEFKETVTALKENTYVDNLMKTGEKLEDLSRFKEESAAILESARFPVHKWESNVESLESENMPNPSKIFGHVWDKREDTLEIRVSNFTEDKPVTKKTILSHLGSIYDPLGVLSPTTAEGKRIYREACFFEKSGWNSEVSAPLKAQWLKWTKQLKDVKVPRSVAGNMGDFKAVHLHVFADASKLACCAATITVVEHSSGVSKGLLTSKSRISKRNTSIPRLELVSGQMAANMVNLYNALRRWPISTTTVWMDSMVALYWISNPGKPWKVFVSNRVRKIAEISSQTAITWKHCPTNMNLADLGSRGASIRKMEEGEWFTGPDWLLDENQWPEQPKLNSSRDVTEECKPIKETIFHTQENKTDEWDALLDRNTYWCTLRVTAWMLRFVHNCQARRNKLVRSSGPIGTTEIMTAKNYWVKREQKAEQPNLQSPGWKLTKEEDTGVLKCEGRIKAYRPTYLAGGKFAEKLIAHTHNQIMHLGTANTMAAIREHWWIPKLRAKVKAMIKRCNICKIFSTKPYGTPPTSAMPTFRTEGSRPFEVTGVDFAGPLSYKISKKERGKCYALIFTCASSRAVHLELTKSQTADEFQRKLNAFISRRMRPRLIISDNAGVFKATAGWIKAIRKSEKLQNYLASQGVQWQFNLARSPWWGGIYERLIREIKKTLYKTLGRSCLSFEGLESVIIDIEGNLNNRPLTYVETEGGEEEALTPNVIMWGRNAYPIDDIEGDENELTKMYRRLNDTKQHAWQRWKREYVHSLMESNRLNGKIGPMPEVGEVVLVVGEGKNRGEWKKGKVLRHVRGKDGVVRGVVLLHKGHTIERPLQLVCPLEIRCGRPIQVEETREEPTTENRRGRRDAAKKAATRIREQAADEN